MSREECDRLIRIIRSRVVDSPSNEDEGDKRPSDIHKMALGKGIVYDTAKILNACCYMTNCC